MAGNVTSQIWLGKNYLGQRDFSRTEIANPDGSVIGLSHQDFAAEVIEQNPWPAREAGRPRRERPRPGSG